MTALSSVALMMLIPLSGPAREVCASTHLTMALPRSASMPSRRRRMRTGRVTVIGLLGSAYFLGRPEGVVFFCIAMR